MLVPSETEATQPFTSIAFIAEGNSNKQNADAFISAKVMAEKGQKVSWSAKSVKNNWKADKFKQTLNSLNNNKEKALKKQVIKTYQTKDREQLTTPINAFNN